MVRRILSKVLPFALLVTAAFAQTVYTQSAPQHCFTADYNCNGIPLANAGTGGSYSTGMTVGRYFSVAINGVVHNGSITSEPTPPPPLRFGETGPFEFTFTTQDGLTGTVSGNIYVGRICGRYCWPLAWIESSTVTVN